MTLAVLDTDLLFDKIKFRKDVLHHYCLVCMRSKEGIQVSHILSTECGLEGMLVAPLVKEFLQICLAQWDMGTVCAQSPKSDTSGEK